MSKGNYTERSQSGFAPILIITVVALVVAVGGGAFFLGRSLPKQPEIQQTTTLPSTVSPNPQQNQFDNPLKSHHSYITFSSDGKTWKEGELIRKSASVPDLIQLNKDVGKFKKGDLLVYFVDANTLTSPGSEQLGIISSSDLGKTWEEQGTTNLTGKTNKGAAVDPSLVQLEDGNLRLYFFGSEVTSGDPAQGPPRGGKNKVFSALSSDGINFKVEEGVRWEENKLTDPEVIFYQSRWYMYYSVGTSSKLATSTDGLNFTAVNITGGNVGGVPGALALDNGVRLFGCGMWGLRTGFASDGVNFKLEGIVSDIKGCDPAAVKLSDGRYALLYKIDESKKQPGRMQPIQPGQQLPPLNNP